MSKEYYNNLQYTRAFKYLQSNPERSRLEFECYLENYPMDYYAYTIYISLLMTLQEFSLAESLINSVEKRINNDKKLANNDAKINSDIKSLFYCRIKLLSYTKRYEELYKYCNDNYDIYKQFKINALMLFCKKKIGLVNSDIRHGDSYLTKQILNYSYSRMRNHIEKHLFEYNSKLDEPASGSIFCEDFPVDIVLSEIRKHIPSHNRLCYGLFEDTYIFKYDYCGKVSNKSANYFKVVCFADSCEIITICPTTDVDEVPYVDLNYLNKSELKSNVKRINQIDKFRARYGL